MSTGMPLANAAQALAAYEHLMRSDPYNVNALCEVGSALQRYHRATESRKCYKLAVQALQQAVREGNVEMAWYVELKLYNAFVKTIEDEKHYFRCFSDWREDMARLGRRFREDLPAPSGDARRVAFVLETGHMLGHTEVLFRLLEQYRAAHGETETAIYVLMDWSDSFVQHAKAMGMEVFYAESDLGHNASAIDRTRWLRQKLKRAGCEIAVWVSVPALASFVLSARIAPVQIYWALRFRPIMGAYIDGYITYGPAHEHSRIFGKQSWRICPVPLTIGTPMRDELATQEIRKQFPESLLLGTLAREAKINSAPFLDAVARILVAHPHVGFLWTGRARDPAIQAFFESRGVAQRCHFIGWVDTALYASGLDIFLETFPLGCGVTGYQALGAGTALLSIVEENTIFGMQWGETKPADPLDYPVLCARNADEYVALAGRLIQDEAFRQHVAQRGKNFFGDELRAGPQYAKRFFDTIAEIAEHARPREVTQS